MKKTVLALVAALALVACDCNTKPARAAEGDSWVKAHFMSRHIGGSGTWWDDNYEEHKWNEFNPGLGYAYEFVDTIELTAGLYENSHNELSLYAGAKWHTGYHRFLDFGVTVGLVSGYEVTQQVDTPVTAFILPELSFRLADFKRGDAPNLHVRLDIGYVPAINIGQEGEATAVMTGTIRVKF